MGRARTNTEVKAEETKIEEEIKQANIEAANTGDKDVDAFLNGETDKVPEGTEEITEEEAEKLQENAEAPKEEETEEAVTYIVEAPNKKYNGVVATVDFKDGKGETSNKVVLDYFKARGYKLTKK